MTDRVACVLNGYIELNSDERKEFVNEINKFINGNESIQGNFCLITESVVLGPMSTVCPCCGR